MCVKCQFKHDHPTAFETGYPVPKDFKPSAGNCGNCGGTGLVPGDCSVCGGTGADAYGRPGYCTGPCGGTGRTMQSCPCCVGGQVQ